MSDFFRGLVERSVDPGRAVRPRLPSLFEPVRSSEGGHEAQGIGEADEELSTGLGAASEGDGDAADRRASLRLDDRTRYVGSRREGVGGEGSTAGRSPGGHTSHDAQPIADAELGAGRTDSGSREARATAGSPAATGVDVHVPALTAAGSPAQDRRDANHRFARLDRKVNLNPDGGIGRGAVRDRRRDPDDAGSAPGAGARAAPSVHVSIGRIEVRAVHPPPAPASRPVERGSEMLTLDEYMSGRRGARR